MAVGGKSYCLREITPSVLPLRVKPPSPRGRLLAVVAKFPAQRKGVPLGELASAARLRGCFYHTPLFLCISWWQSMQAQMAGRHGDMFVVTLSKTSLKKLGAGAACCALVVFSAMLGRFISTRTVAVAAPVNRIESAQDIQTWFTGYGLEVDGASITADKVKIPRRWDDSFSAFNGVVQQSGMDLARYKGKTVEKWSALLPAASNGETSRYGVLLVYKKKAVGAYLLEKPSGTVLGLQDAQNELAKQTSGEDYSGDWGERHDEQLTDSTAQQTSGEPEAEPEAAPQAAPYTELPLDAEGYPVE